MGVGRWGGGGWFFKKMLRLVGNLYRLKWEDGFSEFNPPLQSYN